ncbi:MAG TPA: gluconokinase [Dongiaceae bacterium]|jgi:gluconokinase|nr:gluconokinase [Dongiaceae bacterium]
MAPTRIFIVMGVSGCGKSTIATLLAQRLGWQFQEGDHLHPAENIAKMRSGVPLKDSDRLPWLALIGEKIDRWRAAGQPGIITCSALKRRYRDLLRAGRPEVTFLYLRGSKPTIAARMAARPGHFFPASLLDSQFAALEEPQSDEPALAIDIDTEPERLIEDTLTAFSLNKVSS